MKSVDAAASLWPILAALALTVISIGAHAQSRRFELTSHFALLDVGERAPGFGGTLTYNVTRRFALESTLNFFRATPAAIWAPASGRC